MTAEVGWSIGDVRAALGDDHVATVTLDRPPDNFFDVELVAGIAETYERLDADPRCRAIVLRAEGKHFCAGARLGRRDAAGAERHGRHLYDEAVRLFATSTPVVAAVQGAAIGGGLGLALSADFRIGTPATRLSANFARLGFHHGFGITVTLPAVVGQQRALELLLTGARIDGDAGGRIGLLDRVVEPASLDAAARGFAAEIAASAPLAVRSIRETMRTGLVARVREAMAHERLVQDRLAATADFAEGVAASVERRPPRFEGQ